MSNVWYRTPKPGPSILKPSYSRSNPAPYGKGAGVLTEANGGGLQRNGGGGSFAAPAPLAVESGGGGGGYSGGGGGGGGGGGAAAATVQAQRPLLEVFIAQDFQYKQIGNENARRLEDFDAEGLRARQETEADQALRRAALKRSLDDMGRENAESFAARGLSNSGLVFQEQEKINARGVEQENQIADILTQLLTGQQKGRVDLEAQNRSRLNERLSAITDQYNSQFQL